MVQVATRDPVEGEAALALLEGITDLYVARGRKTLHMDLRNARPADEEILAVILGRSGKLRAPALRVGSRMIVGYNAEILGEQLR